jgi:bacterioferritin (cytochrome b1)
MHRYVMVTKMMKHTKLGRIALPKRRYSKTAVRGASKIAQRLTTLAEVTHPALNYQDSYSRRRKSNFVNCPLISTHVPWQI